MSLQHAQSDSESFNCASLILNDPFRLRRSPDYPGCETLTFTTRLV